jgi:hypothetical protein
MQEQQIKHRFAENYRGLYNEYIDSLVDKVNENFNKQFDFKEKLNKTDLKKLEKYIKLVEITDKSFDFLCSEANKI